MSVDPLTSDLAYVISYAQRHPCDCDHAAHHRWNCSMTPIWAKTMRDLEVNPWTVFRPSDFPGRQEAAK